MARAASQSSGRMAAAGASLLAMVLLCCCAAGVAAQGDIAAAKASSTTPQQLHLCAYITGTQCGASASTLRTLLPADVRTLATSLGISRSSDLVLANIPLLLRLADGTVPTQCPYSITFNTGRLTSAQVGQLVTSLTTSTPCDPLSTTCTRLSNTLTGLTLVSVAAGTTRFQEKTCKVPTTSP